MDNTNTDQVGNQPTDKLASTQKLRQRPPNQNDFNIQSLPPKLPVEKYHLFNRLIGTIDWRNVKGQSSLDELRTMYEAMYPLLDLLANDNEVLFADASNMLKTNGEMICFLKEFKLWDRFQHYLKNTQSKKSGLS